MKLHRDLSITQKTAWFLAHRIREAFEGTVEAYETYIGGKLKNISNAKRKELAGTCCGSVGKTAVTGIKDRDSNKIDGKPVPDTTKETLQGFVNDAKTPGSDVYTDERKFYTGLDNHETVNHSVSEDVNG